MVFGTTMGAGYPAPILLPRKQRNYRAGFADGEGGEFLEPLSDAISRRRKISISGWDHPVDKTCRPTVLE
jgi:hypothetical protein